jgi:hypothetical protein
MTTTLPSPVATAAHTQRQPGDRLRHLCATHTTHGQLADCHAGRGCISFCGIDLSGPAWSCRGADLPVSSDSCLVCEELWRTQ